MSTPDSLTLQKYAQVLVNFALHGGKGVQPGEVVECIFPEHAKPLAQAIHHQLLQSQTHPMMSMQADGFEEDFYRFGQEAQIRFFPEAYLKAKAELLTHTIYILCPQAAQLSLSSLSLKQVRQSILSPVEEWYETKDHAGKYSYTMALWPTETVAHMANLSLEEYWQEFSHACQLDTPDPVQSWQNTFATMHSYRDKLNALPAGRFHVLGDDIDLTFHLPQFTKWLAGRGRNIPSYEIFVTPDYRSLNGWYKSNQVVTKSGFSITEPEFYFEEGTLTKVQTPSSDAAMETLLETPGMEHVGEVSLTDNRISPISRPLGLTLLDENVGGSFGNFHLALGRSYRDCFWGEPRPKSAIEWAALGYNNSVKHVDFVSTSNRQVYFIDTTGESRVIYQNGQFTL